MVIIRGSKPLDVLRSSVRRANEAVACECMVQCSGFARPLNKARPPPLHRFSLCPGQTLGAAFIPYITLELALAPRTGFQMPRNRPSPSLNIISSSSPASPVSTSPSPYRHSQSPFRFVKDSSTIDDEKLSTEEHQLHPTHPPASTSNPAGTSRANSVPHHLRQPSPFQRCPSPLLLAPQVISQSTSAQPYTRPRGLRISNLIKPWIPVILYAMTTFGFLVAIAFWKKEVFEGACSCCHAMCPPF